MGTENTQEEEGYEKRTNLGNIQRFVQRMRHCRDNDNQEFYVLTLSKRTALLKIWQRDTESLKKLPWSQNTWKYAYIVRMKQYDKNFTTIANI